MSSETIIFIGVACYLVIMLVIGIYASKRAGASSSSFIVAGRNMPIWLCSTPIVATWFGGGTMLGGAGAPQSIIQKIKLPFIFPIKAVVNYVFIFNHQGFNIRVAQDYHILFVWIVTIVILD